MRLLASYRPIKLAMQPSLEIKNDAQALDVTRKFVRVTKQWPNGLVGFDFAIGWPELSVELVLPRPAFDEFCITHQVQRLAD